MRRTLTGLALAAALAVPSVDALAAKRPPKRHPAKKKKVAPKPPTTTTTPAPPVVVVLSKDFTGPEVAAGEYGYVKVQITVEKTTTTANGTTTVARKITAVKTPEVPGDTARSVYISQIAIPTLIRETLDAQSADLAYMASGATYTSRAFIQSLQGALALAQQG
jgi:uncharacterized protein with FMN-binding domain